MCENANSSRSWSAGCGESYLSGAGSAERKPTAERQQGAALRLHEFITALFYEVDEQMGAIPKHPEARLWPVRWSPWGCSTPSKAWATGRFIAG
jgi:hypothetical protein